MPCGVAMHLRMPAYRKTATKDDDEKPGPETSACAIPPLAQEYEEDVVQRPAKLPSKLLACRSVRDQRRSFIVVGLSTGIVVVILILLASQIHDFEPQALHSLTAGSNISCDLATEKHHSVERAFKIDLRGSTRLTFTQAKAIDVIWQLIIGAGGRFLMSWISYIVFMDGLVFLTEQTAVSFDLHAHMIFSTTSLYSVWYALKEVSRLSGWRAKGFLIWFAVSTIYVLAFQTVISATGGYVQPSQLGYKMRDGTVLNSTSPAFTTCFEMTHGSLIGLTDGAIINGPSVSQYDAVSHSDGIVIDGDGAPLAASDWELYPQFSDILQSAINNSIPPSIPFDPSSANHQYGGPEKRPFAYYTLFTFQGHDYNFTNRSFSFNQDYRPAYCYQNASLEAYGLDKITQCVPAQDYVWGLSSLMVIIVLLIQAVWMIGTLVIWMNANRRSQLCRHGRKIRGPFRAAQDLAEAITDALGSETCAYSETELADELRRRRGLHYYSEERENMDSSHIGLTTDANRTLVVEELKMYGCTS